MTLREKLESYISEYPELVFQNDGYQEMPKETKENLATQIKEIEELLGHAVWGFVRFQNFKLRPNGEMVLRCQVYYNDERSFIGVSYINLAAFGES